MEKNSRIISIIQRYLFEHGFNQSLYMFQEESEVMYDFDEEQGGNYERIEHILSEYDRLLASRSATHQNVDTRDDEDFLEKSDPTYSQILQKEIENIHLLNPLSVAVHPTNSNLIATSGADKLVKLLDIENGETMKMFSYHEAGVICLDFNPIHPNLLLSGSMDFSHALIDMNGEEEPLMRWKEHKKFVVRVKCIFVDLIHLSCNKTKSPST